MSNNKPYEIPTRNHDLGYIPYVSDMDDPNFIICDSTKILSGRNRIKYAGGRDKLIEDIVSKSHLDRISKSFTGYIVIRFIVNCNSETGRYRAQALNPDFTPAKVSPDLVNQSIALIKDLDQWIKSTGMADRNEYSKYINLKIENGQIQHVLL